MIINRSVHKNLTLNAGIMLHTKTISWVIKLIVKGQFLSSILLPSLTQPIQLAQGESKSRVFIW
jgi:hypothetical protein